MAPTLPTVCGSLPPEGAAPPAAWQSQFRGRYLHGRVPTLPTVRGSLPLEVAARPSRFRGRNLQGRGLAFVCLMVSKRAWGDLTPKHLA